MLPGFTFMAILVVCVGPSSSDVSLVNKPGIVAGLPHFNGAVYPKYRGDNSSTEYMLDEYTCSLGGPVECSGYYTLNCSASGATGYVFQVYSENKPVFMDVSSDECAHVEHEVMKYSACTKNIGEEIQFKCIASNDVGSISLTQKMKFSSVDSTWRLTGGMYQTNGEIILHDSTAEGICHAVGSIQSDPIKHTVCVVEGEGVTADNAACLYESKRLTTCCECEKTCAGMPNISTWWDPSKKLCRVKASKPCEVVCLGQLNVNGDPQVSQFSGSFSFVNSQRTSLPPWVVSTVSGGGGGLLLVAVGIVCLVAAVLGYKRWRKRQRPNQYRPLPDEMEGGGGDLRRAQEGRQTTAHTTPGTYTTEHTAPCLPSPVDTTQDRPSLESGGGDRKTHDSWKEDLDSVPMTMPLLMKFVFQMSSKWYIIGSSFEGIVPKNFDSSNWCKEEKLARILCAWKSSDKDVTWSKFISILRNVGLDSVANEIERTLKEVYHRVDQVQPSTSYDCIPVTIDVVVDIIPEICSQWYLIASCLGGPAAVAARGDIDVEHSPASVKMTKVINTWIEGGQGVHWNKLLSALRTVRMGTYASILQEKLRERLVESEVKNSVKDGVGSQTADSILCDRESFDSSRPRPVPSQTGATDQETTVTVEIYPARDSETSEDSSTQNESSHFFSEPVALETTGISPTLADNRKSPLSTSQLRNTQLNSSPIGVDSRPAESDLLKLVGDHTDAKWREFGIRLEVSSNTCDSIRQEALGVPKECFILMCSKWLSCEVGTGDKDRTWRTVLEAVRLCGFPELADKLERNLLCDSVEEPLPH